MEPAHCERKNSDTKNADIFATKGDPYKGVSVSAADVGACPTISSFVVKLEASLAAWKANGRKGVWIEIPSSRPELIAVAQEKGFEFHHAEPGYLMMCNWLADSENMLPANASHTIGVGILCINEKDELLVVQEATGPAANRKGGFWKVPTGLVNAGEELSIATVREVKEETAVDVEFVSLIGFREMIKAMHGKGNLFFMCLCKLTGNGEITIQPEELKAARWMPLDEFMALPYYQGEGLYAELMRVSIAAAKGENDGGLQRCHRLVDPKNPARGPETCYVPISKL